MKSIVYVELERIVAYSGLQHLLGSTEQSTKILRPAYPVFVFSSQVRSRNLTAGTGILSHRSISCASALSVYNELALGRLSFCLSIYCILISSKRITNEYEMAGKDMSQCLSTVPQRRLRRKAPGILNLDSITPRMSTEITPDLVQFDSCNLRA